MSELRDAFIASKLLASGSKSASITGEVVEFNAPKAAPLTKLAVALEPIQDLHGYANPWPAGGGVNVGYFPPVSNASSSSVAFSIVDGEKLKIKGTATGGDARAYASTQSTDYAQMPLGPYPAGTYTIVANGLVGQSTSDRVVVSAIDSNNTSVVSGVRISGEPGVVPSGTGKPHTFTATAPWKMGVFVHIQQGSAVDCTVTLQLNTGSMAQAWTPFSNICPISGHDSASATRMGKNWFPQASISFGKPETRTKSVNLSIPIPAGVYTVSWVNTGTLTGTTGWGIQAFNANNQVIGNVNLSTGKLTLTDEAARFYFYLGSVMYDNGETVALSDFQIELGESASAYEPYTGSTYPVTFPTPPGTVYGGTVDMVSGVLTVDRAMITLDSSIPSGSSGFRNITELADGVRAEYFPYRAVGKGQHASIVSDKLVYRNIGTGDAYSVDTGGTEPRLYICLPLSYNTEALFRGWFADNPTQIVYELAEPITYQLTPQEIDALKGQNVIWSADGSVTVEYSAESVPRSEWPMIIHRMFDVDYPLAVLFSKED